MKRIIAIAVAAIMAIAPMSAQTRKVVKQAKQDAKYELEYLKEQKYKTLDNTKVDEQVKSFLTAKYSDKSCVEVVGKATGEEDINEAKSKARFEAVSAFPVEDVSNVMFFYRKQKRKYDVICYALVHGASAAVASGNAAQYLRRGETTASSIESMRQEEAKEIAEKAARKAIKKTKKAADRDVKNAKKQAKKKAQQAYDREMEKAGF